MDVTIFHSRLIWFQTRFCSQYDDAERLVSGLNVRLTSSQTPPQFYYTSDIYRSLCSTVHMTGIQDHFRMTISVISIYWSICVRTYVAHSNEQVVHETEKADNMYSHESAAKGNGFVYESQSRVFVNAATRSKVQLKMVADVPLIQHSWSHKAPAALFCFCFWFSLSLAYSQFSIISNMFFYSHLSPCYQCPTIPDLT